MDFGRTDIRTLSSRAAANAQDDEVEKPPRDWKRGVLIFGLGALSWVATYVGMLELIQANMGDLPLIHKVIIGFSVAMLMTMIIWLLDQMFKPHTLSTRLIYAGGYVFLSLISIGFGFGFYWKVLESRGEASRSAESAVGQVQNALHGASTRLEQLQATLVQLTQVSNEKAELERSKGTSCPNSRPGDGPRRKMREDDAQRFSFASEFVKGRVSAVKGDMTSLNDDLVKIASADASTFDAKTGTRNEFMRGLSRKLDMTVTGFNAFRTDPQLTQIRSDLSDRAERTTFGDGRNGSVSCPDPQLQMALRGVVKAIDQLPQLTKPEIAAVEGSEATIEAFRRLTATFYGLLAFKLPPSADELRALQKQAVQSVENPDSPEIRAARSMEEQEAGLSRRDYVPLAVAIFVDLCLLLVSMVQRAENRLDRLMPKMRAAERGPVIQILSRFNEIHRDQQIRENFEIFRHVVFDMNGDYYVAVPLDAPPRLNPKERETLRVEATLLANLFASFEKEKIFKRTLLPTTSSIKRRLARQGSKFAGSDAFRVYKFSDGAWSEIILGAVMGAARRIEGEYRDGTRTRQPVPPAPPAFTHEAGSSERASVLTTPRRAYVGSNTPLAIDAEHEARFGPYATAYRPEPAFARAPQGPRVPWPDPPPPPEAEVSVHAANSNETTQENALADAHQNAARTPATILPLPRTPLSRNVGAERTVEAARDAHATLRVSRETATITLPVSEAAMPESLRRALAKATGSDAFDAADADAMDIPNLPALVDQTAVAADYHLNDQITTDPLTAADRALIGRMAPPAAE